jgi:hypothetical protein
MFAFYIANTSTVKKHNLFYSQNWLPHGKIWLAMWEAVNRAQPIKIDGEFYKLGAFVWKNFTSLLFLSHFSHFDFFFVCIMFVISSKRLHRQLWITHIAPISLFFYHCWERYGNRWQTFCFLIRIDMSNPSRLLFTRKTHSTKKYLGCRL